MRTTSSIKVSFWTARPLYWSFYGLVILIFCRNTRDCMGLLYEAIFGFYKNRPLNSYNPHYGRQFYAFINLNEKYSFRNSIYYLDRNRCRRRFFNRYFFYGRSSKCIEIYCCNPNYFRIDINQAIVRIIVGHALARQNQDVICKIHFL